MNLGRYGNLNVIQLGMHERGAGGGVDRYFWDLYDHLAPSPDLELNAFFFRHRSDQRLERPGEFCLGSTKQPGYRRLWKVRRGVLGGLPALSHPDSVIVASHFAFYAAALLPKLSQMNHVVHFHGPWAAETAVERRHQANAAMKRMIERSVYSSAKAFVTLSQAFKDLLTNEYQVDPERVHVIPGAVDIHRFFPGNRRSARGRLGWPQDATILFCLRRLVRRMGLENLIEAFQQVAGKHSDTMLIVGGAGPLRMELESQINRCDLVDRIRLVGFVQDEDLVLAYQAADLSIVPSQSLEGFGLTTLESLACGTPVLVTPVGGLPEAVGGLARELVLSGRQSDDIAAWLDRFLGGKLFLPSGETCRQYIEGNFSWPTIAKQVKALYWHAATI
jgi:glycosyltransferase involved in cell wall biosynthesis